MATPYNPNPSGRAGAGEAFILGNDNTALNILRQGEAARQRAAQLAEAARQKQLQQDAKDYLDASKFNLEGGRIFQKGLTDVVAPQTQQQLMAVYQDKALTPMQRSMKAREIQNAYEGERQMTLQKNQFIDDFLKQKDDELNKDNIAFDLAEAARKPDGSLLRASEFDEQGTVNGILGRAKNLNAPVVVQNAIKGIQPAITEAVANAGKIGGIRTQTTTTARFFDVDPATGKVRRTRDGQEIINITDDSLALLKQNKRFSLLVQDRVARAKEQGVELDEKQAAADLIGPYGTYKETTSASRNAQARAASSAGKPKYTVNTTPVQNAFTVQGGDVTENVGTGIGWGATATGQRAGFGAYARMAQPTYTTATNPNGKPFKLQGLRTRRLFLPDDKGGLRFQTNNDQPIYGEAQDGVAILRNPKTGEYKLAPADEAQANSLASKLLNQGWILGTGVAVAIPKNKNFAADYKGILARLKAAESAPREASMMPSGARKKTDDELEAQAFEMAANGTAQAIIPYDEETSGSIDNQTAGAYREFNKGQGQRGKALRTAGAKKADPFGFAPKAAPAKPAAAPKTPKVKTVGKNNALGF